MPIKKKTKQMHFSFPSQFGHTIIVCLEVKRMLQYLCTYFQMFVYLFLCVYVYVYVISVPQQKHKCLLKQNNDCTNTEATNKRINVSAVIILTIRKLNHN